MQQLPAQIGAPAKPPISAHRAFPLIVGLWFAALLGLGTIVLPAVALEKAAGVTGLSGLFPQTDAPLTAGARAAFALLATILGLVGGLALARRMAETKTVSHAPRRRTPLAQGRSAPPRPLSVHDDLGEEAIAPTMLEKVAGDEQRKPIPGRRRALAAIEDERPSDFLLAAPLPGDEATSPPELPADEDAMSERPSDIEIPAQYDEAAEELDAAEPYVPLLDTRKPRDFAAPSMSEVSDETLEPLTLEPIDAPLEDLGMVQLAERLGRSMHRRLTELKVQPEPEEAPLAVPPPVVPDALRAFMDSPPEEFAPQPAAAREEPIEAPAQVVPASLQSFAFAAFDAEDDDDDDEAHDLDSFTLPLAAMPQRPFDGPPLLAEPVEDEAEDEEAVADESYSSLLSMTNPFRPAEEFVRIDEPQEDDDEIEPAVVFPSEEAAVTGEAIPDDETEAAPETNIARPFDAPHQPAPSTAPLRARMVPDPVETERALRSALANLQRMSGTA